MLSCSHTVMPVSLSLRQKSLFALLLSLNSSDCLCWDCQPIHKTPSSTWGAVLLTAPQDFIHIWRDWMSSLTWQWGFRAVYKALVLLGMCCAPPLFTLLTLSELWKEAFRSPVSLWRAALTKKPHRSLNVQGWFVLKGKKKPCINYRGTCSHSFRSEVTDLN